MAPLEVNIATSLKRGGPALTRSIDRIVAVAGSSVHAVKLGWPKNASVSVVEIAKFRPHKREVWSRNPSRANAYTGRPEGRA
jgi:hypothetical protein